MPIHEQYLIVTVKICPLHQPHLLNLVLNLCGSIDLKNEKERLKQKVNLNKEPSELFQRQISVESSYMYLKLSILTIGNA